MEIALLDLPIGHGDFPFQRAAVNPITTAPSTCASAMVGLTTSPQSTAQTITACPYKHFIGLFKSRKIYDKKSSTSTSCFQE